MSISMHIQNLDKFYKRVLKILSGNKKIMTKEKTEGKTNRRKDRQPKSNLAPPPPSRALFQSGALNIRKMCNKPKLDLVSMIAYIKFGEILSICSQDIKRKRNFDINQGP